MKEGDKGRMVLFAVLAACMLLAHCAPSVPAGAPWDPTGTQKGCQSWEPSGSTEVCCSVCKPGNRIFHRCGSGNTDDLCVPCEEGTFTKDPSRLQCTRCRECAGALVFAAACTTTRDTQCGCREGLRCGDGGCTFCVTECGKGQEPDKERSCRACPNGTFNDQIHQHCKPWRTMCPHPDEHIVKGDAETDSKCLHAATNSTKNTTPTTMTTTTTLRREPEMADTLVPWWIVAAACCITLLIPLILMIKIMRKLKGKKWTKPIEPAQKPTKRPTKEPYITTPTDDPRSLHTPTECSFHEPLEEEEASSSESLATDDSGEGSTRKLCV